ncbi:MAG TPA: CBS domain-containing protein [Nitrososphaeraceae archaeon]|nr:CBS domain-containing protein [Nitrososphaeraceae archaeon]
MNIRRLPVIDRDGDHEGTITEKDIINAIAKTEEDHSRS